MPSISRRVTILSILCCLAMASSARAQGFHATKRPNIVFVFADDWGWGDLRCYGHPVVQTPNLDRLARQGILFTQFYSASGVCSPSRAAVLTGHFPARHSIHGHLAQPQQNADRGMPNWLDPKVTTVAGLLQEAGYATGHFGKWHLGSGEGAPAISQYGFDEHKGVNSTDDFPKLWGAEFRPRSTEIIIDETIGFIERNRDKPFYAQAWLLDTHAYLQPTDEQMKAYPRHRGALKIYYSVVTDADRHIGRLMDKLDELGLAENTLFVFSSDNGPEDIHISNASHSGVGSPGPFRGRKRSLYEGGVRMPFIVRWPAGTPAGLVDDESVIGAVDWLPTICAITDVNLPEGLNLDGEDISRVLGGQPTNRNDPLMWEWRYPVHGHVFNQSPMLSIRDGKWKLLMNPDRSRVDLYDIPVDPRELDNRANEQPEVVERLAKQVLAWQRTLPAGPVATGAGSNNYRWPKAVEGQ